MMFEDRRDAGERLAARLKRFKGSKNTIVLGLPRGGVVVAAEVAKTLKLPLDVICPRKIGAPYNPELAIGAVTETGQAIFNEDIVEQLDIPQSYIQEQIKKEMQQAQRRLNLFRKDLPKRDLKSKTLIIVDDGLATGATMKAAIKSVKVEGASKIVVAVPVSPVETLEEIKQSVDEVECLDTPRFFQAIGQFYLNFNQTSDDEVLQLLGEVHATNPDNYS